MPHRRTTDAVAWHIVQQAQTELEHNKRAHSFCMQYAGVLSDDTKRTIRLGLNLFVRNIEFLETGERTIIRIVRRARGTS